VCVQCSSLPMTASLCRRTVVYVCAWVSIGLSVCVSVYVLCVCACVCSVCVSVCLCVCVCRAVVHHDCKLVLSHGICVYGWVSICLSVYVSVFIWCVCACVYCACVCVCVFVFLCVCVQCSRPPMTASLCRRMVYVRVGG